MTITRARKPAAKPKAKPEKAPLTVEQFIAKAEPLPPPEQPEPPPAREAPLQGRDERALAIVRRHIPWATGAGVVPMPGVDFALIGAVQMHMLARLCEEYRVPFREEFARSTVGTLLAGLVQYAVAGNLAAAAVQYIPIAGPLIGFAVLPSFAAAATFALGKVFITHFESGGTFLDFDPRKVEAHFRAEFEQARGGRAA